MQISKGKRCHSTDPCYFKHVKFKLFFHLCEVDQFCERLIDQIVNLNWSRNPYLQSHFIHFEITPHLLCVPSHLQDGHGKHTDDRHQTRPSHFKSSNCLRQLTDRPHQGKTTLRVTIDISKDTQLLRFPHESGYIPYNIYSFLII